MGDNDGKSGRSLAPRKGRSIWSVLPANPDVLQAEGHVEAPGPDGRIDPLRGLTRKGGKDYEAVAPGATARSVFPPPSAEEKGYEEGGDSSDAPHGVGYPSHGAPRGSTSEIRETKPGPPPPPQTEGFFPKREPEREATQPHYFGILKEQPAVAPLPTEDAARLERANRVTDRHGIGPQLEIIDLDEGDNPLDDALSQEGDQPPIEYGPEVADLFGPPLDQPADAAIAEHPLASEVVTEVLEAAPSDTIAHRARPVRTGALRSALLILSGLSMCVLAAAVMHFFFRPSPEEQRVNHLLNSRLESGACLLEGNFQYLPREVQEGFFACRWRRDGAAEFYCRETAEPDPSPGARRAYCLETFNRCISSPSRPRGPARTAACLADPDHTPF